MRIDVRGLSRTFMAQGRETPALLDVDLEVADDATAFAAKVLAVMDPAAGDGMGRLARARIVADYAWTSRFARLDELIAAAIGFSNLNKRDLALKKVR